MQWSDISFAPPTRTLRQFAGLWLLFFGLAAGVQGLLRDRPVVGLVLGAVALAIGLPGLVWPSLVRPVYVGAMVVTFPIGWVVSKVLLAGMYYAIITPVGLAFRLIGRDALGRKPHPAAETYWQPKVLPTDPRRYFRMF
jgi:hypothetical protein